LVHFHYLYNYYRVTIQGIPAKTRTERPPPESFLTIPLGALHRPQPEPGTIVGENPRFPPAIIFGCHWTTRVDPAMGE
jgi:hypothetical protein